MSEHVLQHIEAAEETSPGTAAGYVKIWGVLLVLMGASIGAGFLGARALSAILVFALASAKAVLVLAYFMHLRLAPRWITVLMVSVLAVVAILLAALVPDIVHVYGGGS